MWLRNIRRLYKVYRYDYGSFLYSSSPLHSDGPASPHPFVESSSPDVNRYFFSPVAVALIFPADVYLRYRNGETQRNPRVHFHRLGGGAPEK